MDNLDITYSSKSSLIFGYSHLASGMVLYQVLVHPKDYPAIPAGFPTEYRRPREKGSPLLRVSDTPSNSMKICIVVV